MMKNNCQAGYTTTLSPTFLLKSLRQFSDKFFQRMLLTQAFQCKKNHSIPSWYEESKNSKTGLKNWNKLCSRTSEVKKDLFRSWFWGIKYWTSFCNYLDAARRDLQFEYSRSQNGLRMRKIHLFYWTVRKTDSNPNSGTRLILDRSNFFSSLFFFSRFFFLFLLSLFLFFPFFSFFSLSFFFQDKLDKMQIGSGEDVNDLNYDYDNEQRVARGGN